MLNAAQVMKLRRSGRRLQKATFGDPDLGPFMQLPGTWSNDSLPGRGWNMIALPDATSPVRYRLLVNQYNEALRFDIVDKTVPNRGLDLATGQAVDQIVVTLDYEQRIQQIAAEDFPPTNLPAPNGSFIHHEPGLFLLQVDQTEGDADLARLATVPHGNVVLAMGRARNVEGAPLIPDEDALPVGVPRDLESPYLSPYLHFQNNPFLGIFDPLNAAELLRQANQGVNIVRSTEIFFDSTIPTGGIHNIPFIVQHADATVMRSRFWIHELDELEADGSHKLRLQYLQMVMLEFFPLPSDPTRRIGWPHISVNTLERRPSDPGS